MLYAVRPLDSKPESLTGWVWGCCKEGEEKEKQGGIWGLETDSDGKLKTHAHAHTEVEKLGALSMVLNLRLPSPLPAGGQTSLLSVNVIFPHQPVRTWRHRCESVMMEVHQLSCSHIVLSAQGRGQRDWWRIQSLNKDVWASQNVGQDTFCLLHTFTVSPVSRARQLGEILNQWPLRHLFIPGRNLRKHVVSDLRFRLLNPRKTTTSWETWLVWFFCSTPCSCCFSAATFSWWQQVSTN